MVYVYSALIGIACFCGGYWLHYLQSQVFLAQELQKAKDEYKQFRELFLREAKNAHELLKSAEEKMPVAVRADEAALRHEVSRALATLNKYF